MERLLGPSPSGSAYFASAEYPSYSPLPAGKRLLSVQSSSVGKFLFSGGSGV